MLSRTLLVMSEATFDGVVDRLTNDICDFGLNPKCTVQSHYGHGCRLQRWPLNPSENAVGPGRVGTRCNGASVPPRQMWAYHDSPRWLVERRWDRSSGIWPLDIPISRMILGLLLLSRANEGDSASTFQSRLLNDAQNWLLLTLYLRAQN